MLNDELGQQQGVVEQSRSAWHTEYKTALGIAADEVQLYKQDTKVVTTPGIEAALQNQLLNAEVELMLNDVRIRYEETQPLAKPTPWDIKRNIQDNPKVQRLQVVRAQLESKIQDHKEVSANPAASPILKDLEKQKKTIEENLASTQDRSAL